MTFLDTVDGKLARVTFTASQIGHVLDHGLDLVHPPFWYLAWAIGLAGSFSLALIWHDPATTIIIGGYILGRLLEGIFLLVFHMEIHSWRPIDSVFPDDYRAPKSQLDRVNARHPHGDDRT